MDVVFSGNRLVSNPPSGDIEEMEDSVDRKFRSFNNFDVAMSPPSDHQFLNPPIETSSFVCTNNFNFLNFLWRSNGGAAKSGGRKERIEKEWKILKSSLPNSIFVRVYSSRPELMRVAIMGLPDSAQTNPYAYGVFFFDIFLPAQYPAKPPQIHHRFKGVAVEVPRFTQSGWDPNRSSLLQALGVLQGHVEGRGKEYQYHEVLMLSHRAMVRTLREPPMGFKDFVKGYFRKYSHDILMQLKGHLEGQGFRKSAGEGQELTGRFTFLQLFNDFVKNGSYCTHIH